MSVSQMITEEQLKSIKNSQSKINEILLNIGFLESKKNELLSSYSDASKENEDIKSELEKEYGSININLEDGSFTPAELDKENMDGH
jgi:hypothetical protein